MMDNQMMGTLAAAYTLLLSTKIVDHIPPRGQEILDRLRDCIAEACVADAEEVRVRYETLAGTIRYAAPEVIDEILGSLLRGDR